MAVLHPHRHDDDFKFAWPLIKDVVLRLCVASVTGQGVEIRPPVPPIAWIPAFARARHPGTPHGRDTRARRSSLIRPTAPRRWIGTPAGTTKELPPNPAHAGQAGESSGAFAAHGPVDGSHRIGAGAGRQCTAIASSTHPRPISMRAGSTRP
ncbi:hypothetical protein [Embleya sp. NBC_00896]|uniref:hypothetical protein n=1 Tax=Embleya sp. NBC_00896 TaxID=2975961 RepID=UPI002F907B18|nr:hypothetical protein OG928_45405 [Embleya sp. NBC_00896]